MNCFHKFSHSKITMYMVCMVGCKKLMYCNYNYAYIVFIIIIVVVTGNYITHNYACYMPPYI